MSLKYNWYFVDVPITVDLLFAAYPVALEVKPDTSSVAGELAHPVQLGEHGVAVKAVTSREVEIVGEPRPGRYALT